MARVGRVARCVVLLLPLLAFVHQTNTAAAQGEALFTRVVGVAESDAHAPYATYDVVVSFTNGERNVVDTWSTREDVTHASVMADAFTAEERSAPSMPHGFNIVARRKMQVSAPRSFDEGATATVGVTSKPVNPERTGDSVGPVAFAVDQNFGLTPPRSYIVAHDARTMADRSEDVATIGRTAADVGRYRVALLDQDGTMAHLGLTPLRDAYHNRLRELWVDSNAGYVREAIVQGVGDRAPFDRIRWHVDFERREGGSYVTQERALEPVEINGTLENLRITFANLALLPYSPFKYTFGISTPVRTLRDP